MRPKRISSKTTPPHPKQPPSATLTIPSPTANYSSPRIHRTGYTKPGDIPYETTRSAIKPTGLEWLSQCRIYIPRCFDFYLPWITRD
ncbi:hypothetical protein BO78DRAFT_171639 [Aspergillus sclerotiicarbonarius CBS 121057]|uniref:Uncharacterized protein n=1 Tax=Aspergillus sclerotiicarbonarius (strain CBS 121057 / IBT 28362) TaxID=1448318 RepID=A0A319E4V1_ASPSB|nr:hypothetical protein BO78DRAFT_171639 [Aspergillus sclerotiicarbonarius CBS 121057]